MRSMRCSCPRDKAAREDFRSGSADRQA
jgi:hypothetical protein